MKTKEFVHHGLARAAAVIIDVGLVGEDEARRRALAHYRPGTTIHELDRAHWLIVLPEPRELDTRAAPGLILLDRAGQLVGAPELDDGVDGLVYWSEGSIAHIRRTSLPPIDPSEWIDVDGLRLDRLEPLDVVAVATLVETAAAPAEPDFRLIAHIQARSAESQAIGQELSRPIGARGVGVGRSAAGAASWRPTALQSLTAFLSRLVLRSPLANEVGKRHARYLARLERQFSTGELDEALRNAIPLGGLGGAALTLRLPSRRADLGISRQASAGGSAIPFGLSIYEYLRTMYRRAAEQLEAAGRIDEAAFALAELLGSPQECIALLERHERFELAATIAEGRRLDASLVVRLWWLAGNRARAVALARRHRVFAAVIDRLTATDPVQGRELRLEWVDALERSGDLLGAVEAGWPDHQIRHLLINVIERGVALGGPAGAALHAYRLALRATDADRLATRELVEAFEAEDAASLRAFTLALAEAKGDPTADREISTLTLRTLARLGRFDKDRSYSRAHREIRQRGDPMLVADLPALAHPVRSAVTIESPAQRPGLIAILDAAPLPNDTTLVALGEIGCRLLTPDGRTAARWDVSAHRLVVADHGGTALVISVREGIEDVHVLDLTTRKTRQYGGIRSSLTADSYDGAAWAIVDDRGLAFLDLLADQPRVVWRELEPGWTVHRLMRDQGSLAALITIPAKAPTPQRTQVWQWGLPDVRLDQRPAIEPPTGAREVALLSSGWTVWTIDGDVPIVMSHAVRYNRLGLSEDRVLGSQEQVALVREGPAGQDVLVRLDPLDAEPRLRVRMGTEAVGFRAVGHRAAVWDSSGRLVTADVAAGRLISVIRLVA